VLGAETQRKLASLRVLCIGARGAAVESLKNLVLAGPAVVDIVDDAPAGSGDDSHVNFWNATQAGGVSAASAMAAALAELNPYVRVRARAACDAGGSSVSGTGVDRVWLSEYGAVMAFDVRQAALEELDEACRGAGAALVACNLYGAFGRVFVDRGPRFFVSDPRGEQMSSALVGLISKAQSGYVTLPPGERNPFEDGDFVKFTDLSGMSELQELPYVRISNCTPVGFCVGDTSSFSEHVSGGYVTKTLVRAEASHRSLRDCSAAPEAGEALVDVDLSLWGRSKQLHVAALAMEAAMARRGTTLEARSAAVCEEVAADAKAIAARAAEAGTALLPAAEGVNETLVRKLSLVASAKLAPLCALFGGIVAQEVIKVTEKYTSLNQLLYVDVEHSIVESAPADSESPSHEFEPVGGRYDSLIALIGRTSLRKLQSQRVFLVGAGALGCEMLKNFALLGVGSRSAGGRITVTDMDNIELSNLNRQFLFRPRDIGQPKSERAAAAARAMNSDLDIVAMTTPVGPDTEGVFDDAFWADHTAVVNALDNLEARLYVDARCVFYGKPLLESGTLGPKCNTQVVLPHATECYGDSTDPADDSIPLCTIKNFPFKIEHCIEWAREAFYSTFTGPAADCAAMLADAPAFFARVGEEPSINSRRRMLEGVQRVLNLASRRTLEGIVEAARLQFEDMFVSSVRRLLDKFPPGYTDSRGNNFWSGTKRQPEVIVFDAANPDHLLFIHATAHVLAQMLGAPEVARRLGAVPDSELLTPILAAIHVPDFVPRPQASAEAKTQKGHAAAAAAAAAADDDDDDEVVASLDDDDDEVVASLDARLRDAVAARASDSGIKSVEFDKDDDSNMHVDLMTAASNCRAQTYRIPPAKRLNVKLIAGKITPAMATTTCTVTGLVCVELIKLALGKPASCFRNTFCNLGVNVYVASEPNPPKRNRSKTLDPISGMPVRAVPEGWTVWDKVEVRIGDASVGQLIEHLEARFDASVSMITAGKFMLFAPSVNTGHQQRRPRKVREVFAEVTKAQLPAARKYILLDVGMESSDGSADMRVPSVVFWFA